jgi:DNA polymerase III subunit alpha
VQACLGGSPRPPAVGLAARTVRQARRLEARFELDVITDGFPGYFLIVADFIKWARRERHSGRAGARLGRRLAGRLGADHHRSRSDALNLLFERFLNPERVSMPDFDIDFCEDRRDEVIRYVQEKYGATGRADHHLRQAEGARRAARRRPGAADALRPGRPAAKLIPNHPANPVDARAGARTASRGFRPPSATTTRTSSGCSIWR